MEVRARCLQQIAQDDQPLGAAAAVVEEQAQQAQQSVHSVVPEMGKPVHNVGTIAQCARVVK